MALETIGTKFLMEVGMEFHVDYVVHVDSVEVFKKRLDKFWSNQPVKFDWRASLTGTGDRSEFLVE